MKITILTLFPEMFKGPFDFSILKRAKEKGIIDIEFVNIRDFGIGAHKTVDDTPYGGGIGMILKVDVVHKAIVKAKQSHPSKNQKVILLSATGKTFNQQKAKNLSKTSHLILICGHYEGIDERIKQFVDEEISIGDFVMTGGEIPAIVIVDAVARLIPGVITTGAVDDESFSKVHDRKILLEYPHYTKPRVYKNQSVPDVLLSGDHKKIEEWRKTQALDKTSTLRPDLLKNPNSKRKR